MIKNVVLASIVVITTFAAINVQAEKLPTKKMSVSLKVGTLGVGLEARKPISKKMDLRFGINKLDLSRSATLGDVDYSGDLNLQTISFLADWYPYSKNFFITGGLMINGNEINVKGSKTGAITVGNRPFVGTAAFDTKVSFGGVSPYLGIGYHKRLSKKGLSFLAEAGLLFQGDPKVRLDVQAPAFSGVTQSDVDVERKQIQNDLKETKTWPVLSLGLVYQF